MYTLDGNWWADWWNMSLLVEARWWSKWLMRWLTVTCTWQQRETRQQHTNSGSNNWAKHKTKPKRKEAKLNYEELERSWCGSLYEACNVTQTAKINKRENQQTEGERGFLHYLWSYYVKAYIATSMAKWKGHFRTWLEFPLMTSWWHHD